MARRPPIGAFNCVRALLCVDQRRLGARTTPVSVPGAVQVSDAREHDVVQANRVARMQA